MEIAMFRKFFVLSFPFLFSSLLPNHCHSMRLLTRYLLSRFGQKWAKSTSTIKSFTTHSSSESVFFFFLFWIQYMENCTDHCYTPSWNRCSKVEVEEEPLCATGFGWVWSTNYGGQINVKMLTFEKAPFFRHRWQTKPKMLIHGELYYEVTILLRMSPTSYQSRNFLTVWNARNDWKYWITNHKHNQKVQAFATRRSSICVFNNKNTALLQALREHFPFLYILMLFSFFPRCKPTCFVLCRYRIWTAWAQTTHFHYFLLISKPLVPIKFQDS